MQFGTYILQIRSVQKNVLDILNLKNGGEIEEGRHCASSNNKLILFSIEEQQIRDFCVYHGVFWYARHSGMART